MQTNNPQSSDWIQIIIAITAIIALVQPWLIAIFKKHIKRPVIQGIRNRTMKIYFTNNGLYIFSFFTFVVKNADDVLTNAKLVINKTDKKLYELEWFMFSDPANNSLYNERNERVVQSSSIDSYPIYLVNNVPRIYTVHFHDFELEKEMSECVTVEDAMTKMLLAKGKYSLDLLLYNSEGKPITYRYYFSINENQYEILKKNIRIAFDSADTEKEYDIFRVELKDTE